MVSNSWPKFRHRHSLGLSQWAIFSGSIRFGEELWDSFLYQILNMNLHCHHSSFFQLCTVFFLNQTYFGFYDHFECVAFWFIYKANPFLRKFNILLSVIEKHIIFLGYAISFEESIHICYEHTYNFHKSNSWEICCFGFFFVYK